MIRPSAGNGFGIFKADIESGLVKFQKYNTINEWWIYRKKEVEGLLYLMDGKKHKMENKMESYLYAIIVTQDSSHTVKEVDKMLFVQGIKFEGEHINYYLSKTHRHSDRTVTLPTKKEII